MADSYITPGLELYEVVNAFPVIKNCLEKLHIGTSDIKEGLSVHDFLEKKRMSEDEIDILLKKLNHEVNSFLKKKDEVVEETSSDSLDNSLENISKDEFASIIEEFEEEE